MNKIVTEKCRTIKALGRQALSGHWGEAILFFLLCKLLLSGPSFIYGFLPEKIQVSILANIINTYNFVIAGPVRLSMAYYFVEMFRRKPDNGLINIKFGFTYFSRALILYIRIMLFTWLWSLLFIIPGLIAVINYSQAFFILADDPNKTAAQCMTESKYMMQGNRWKYIELLLSFILLFLITTGPSLVFHNILDAEKMALAQKLLAEGDSYNAFFYAVDVHPLANISMLLTIFPSVYLYASQAVFFDLLCDKLIIRRAEEFEEAETIDAEYNEVSNDENNYGQNE